MASGWWCNQLCPSCVLPGVRGSVVAVAMALIVPPVLLHVLLKHPDVAVLHAHKCEGGREKLGLVRREGMSHD